MLIKPNGQFFIPPSRKRFMPKKISELFIDAIAVERETVTKFLGRN